MRRLCEIFQKYGHLENLNDLMTMVNNQVAEWDTVDNKKQMSSITSSLRGRVEFARSNEALFVDSIVDQMERAYFDKAIEKTATILLTQRKLCLT